MDYKGNFQKIAITAVHYSRMKKDRISKKQNISSIEEIPKLINFRKLRQANVILHGKSAGFPTQKFQRELQDLFAESVKVDDFKHLKKVIYQVP